MTLTDADLDRMSNWPVDSDVPALVAEIRRLRTALHQIARVEPGLADLPGVAKWALGETETE